MFLLVMAKHIPIVNIFIPDFLHCLLKTPDEVASVEIIKGGGVIFTHKGYTRDGQTSSVTPSVRGPQECGALRDHRTCNPQDTSVMYAPAGLELFLFQCISVLGRQLSLHERLPILELSQPGPYAGPYCAKAHNQHEPKHRGGPRIHPDPLSDHPPGRLSPRHTGVLA